MVWTVEHATIFSLCKENSALLYSIYVSIVKNFN